LPVIERSGPLMKHVAIGTDASWLQRAVDLH
jgi:hypothetical protein